MIDRTWTPLLLGADRDRARRAADELARNVHRASFEDVDAVNRSGLVEGAAAAALFLGHHAMATGSEASLARAGSLVDEALSFADRAKERGLFFGAVSAAWVAAHLAHTTRDRRFAWDLSDLDDAIASWLIETPSEELGVSHDLMKGLTGIGIYLLEPQVRERRALDAVVAHLDRSAISKDGTSTWAFTGSGTPMVTCGAAHGVAAVALFLARAGAEGSFERAWLWLSSVRRTSTRSIFPRGMHVGETSPGSIADADPGWCGGDAGVAAALHAAARAMNRDDVERDARAVASFAAQSREDLADAAFCHGTSGLAHLFHRLANDPDDATMTDAARFWMRRTLDLLDGSPQCATKVGLLDGASGIGLALLAASYEAAPSWDRVLGISGGSS